MSGKLLPGTPFPVLDLPRAGGGRISNADFTAPFMTILNVYRGLHCPRCRRQMEQFQIFRAAFEAEGLEVISISTDPQDRAEQVVAEWDIGEMAIGYDLSLDQARQFGCFISEAIRDGEKDFFAEAALFMVRPDGVLWGSSVNTFPFLRPTAEMVLDAVDVAKNRSYPPRGTVAG